MNTKYAQQVLEQEKTVTARHENYLNWIVWLTVLVFIVFGGAIYYWVTADYKLFTFNKVAVSDKIVRPGEAIIFDYDYCKETDVEVKTESHLVGTMERYARPVAFNTQKKGCYKLPIPVIILPDRQPDTYHFHYTLCAKVNPIREVCEEHNSPEFKVSTESAR